MEGVWEGLLRDYDRIMEGFTGNHKRLWGNIGGFYKDSPTP